MILENVRNRTVGGAKVVEPLPQATEREVHL